MKDKLLTIAKWTGLGFVSAYLIASLYMFSFYAFYMIAAGDNFAFWVKQLFMYSIVMGLGVGLLKASNVIVTKRWD